jgi:hypothetical protein
MAQLSPPAFAAAVGSLAELAEIAPPFPVHKGIAPPLRVRRRTKNRPSVHTLESNAGADGRRGVIHTLTRKTRKELAKERKEMNRWLSEQREMAGWEDCEPATEDETKWRHEGWADTRERIIAAMRRVGTKPVKLARLINCGSNLWAYAHKVTGEPRLHANTCKERTCEPCSISKANLIAGNVRDVIEKRRFQKYSHIVLTMVSRPAPLAKLRRWIYKGFKRLRNVRMGTVPKARNMRGRMVNWWGFHVRGGAAFFEATFNESTKLWHCHLHIIAEARFIPHDDLSSLWESVTSRLKRGRWLASSIVHIERIDTAAGAAAEVCKYAAKGACDLAEIGNDDALDEYIIAMRGARLCFTFGTWRTIPLTRKPVFNPDDWKRMGKLTDLLARERAGDAWAIRFLEILRAVKQRAARPPPRGVRH